MLLEVVALLPRGKHGPRRRAHSNRRQKLVGHAVREQVFNPYAGCCLIRIRTGTGTKCQRHIEEVLVGAICYDCPRERAP